jgi:hypothetical protein
MVDASSTNRHRPVPEERKHMMNITRNLTKMLGGALLSGGLALAGLGMATGTAQAQPSCPGAGGLLNDLGCAGSGGLNDLGLAGQGGTNDFGLAGQGGTNDLGLAGKGIVRDLGRAGKGIVRDLGHH